MALQLDVTTIAGESFAVTAYDSWLVRDLKDSIDRSRTVPKSRQRLFTVAGEELKDERPLIDFCPCGVGPQTLMLVKVSKSQLEVDFFEEWLEKTPTWLQSATESVMDNCHFSALRKHPNYLEIGHNDWAGRRGGFKPGAPVLPDEPASLLPDKPAVADVCPVQVAKDHSRLFRTGKELLSATKTVVLRADSRYLLRFRATCQPLLATTDWVGSQRGLVHMCRVRMFRGKRLLNPLVTATMEAMMEAIALEPFVMLPYADDEIILSAMRRQPGLSSVLRGKLHESRCFFYEALECDAKLRNEFLATAGKTEINSWLWEREEFQGPGFADRSVAKAWPSAPTEAVKRGKSYQCCRERNAKTRRDKLPRGNRKSYQKPRGQL